jgi:hypothetical protein
VWGHPFTRLPRLDLQQEHGVDFLERPTGRFGQEEEDQQDGEEVAGREDVAVRETDRGGDERGCEADEEIE